MSTDGRLDRQEIIENAQQFVQWLSTQRTECMLPRGGKRTVQGTDPNELKKLLAWLKKHRDLEGFGRLLETMPRSNLVKRSGQTAGYIQNIGRTVAIARARWSNVGIDDWIQILGWACRMV